MRSLKALGLLAGFALAGAAPVSAQVSGPHTLHFVGGSGVGFNGWQVGAYHATLDGAPISIWCTDFFNHSANGSVWESGLGGSSPDLSKTRFGTLAGQPLQYKRAAALTSLFGTLPTSQWGYIHAAIWELMADPAPYVVATPAQQTSVNTYLTWSLNNWNHFDYSKMFVLTDVNVTGGTRLYPHGCQGLVDNTTCGAQEYLTGQLTVAPEPAAVGLMATGLVGLSLMTVVRRRKKS
jgi:hypothetical protein